MNEATNKLEYSVSEDFSADALEFLVILRKYAPSDVTLSVLDSEAFRSEVATIKFIRASQPSFDFYYGDEYPDYLCSYLAHSGLVNMSREDCKELERRVAARSLAILSKFALTDKGRDRVESLIEENNSTD